MLTTHARLLEGALLPLRSRWAGCHRDSFEPSAVGVRSDEPGGMLAVNAVCAETDEEAARLRATAEASYKRMRRGVVGSPPPVETAIDELGGVPEPTPNPLPDGSGRGRYRGVPKPRRPARAADRPTRRRRRRGDRPEPDCGSRERAPLTRVARRGRWNRRLSGSM